MGKIIQKAKITSFIDSAAKNKTAEFDIDFLVDTGAAMLCLPIGTPAHDGKMIMDLL